MAFRPIKSLTALVSNFTLPHASIQPFFTTTFPSGNKSRANEGSMPSSDYSSVIGGGLKLKGVKDSGVKKKKTTKKGKKSTSIKEGESTKSAQGNGEENGEGENTVQKALADEDGIGKKGVEESEVRKFGKTEAQRRHDEMRRKRLDERLQKEGIKTHKERVEALNSYLSGLSEHHDMPRIGPG